MSWLHEKSNNLRYNGARKVSSTFELIVTGDNSLDVHHTIHSNHRVGLTEVSGRKVGHKVDVNLVISLLHGQRCAANHLQHQGQILRENW